ncbi:hypothetical protein MSAN_02325400 [Mycena sanguinolenta]|uniref:DUF6534 domain-containing protein n=1 Tax=Mycena sanguinolenta TaxID=230812 RepID=A0A8H6X8E8_9AGAR|nr:hypothetical protein MSAN_02325400 [Mycena sanguinolenta]
MRGIKINADIELAVNFPRFFGITGHGVITPARLYRQPRAGPHHGNRRTKAHLRLRCSRPDVLPSMASAPAPALPNVELSYGPMLIGIFFEFDPVRSFIGSGLCFGGHDRNPIRVGSVDIDILPSVPEGSLWMRLFVGFLFFVETANTSLDMAMMYQPLILEYGQKLLFFPIVFMTEPLCVVLVSMPIQLFFAWRIHQLTKSRWIPAIISVLAMASFAGGVWTATMVQILREFAKKPLLHNSALLWFLAACVADILITVSLVMTLTKKKTGFSATDSVLDTIIRMTIQTGMITALFSILDVACFMILPASAAHPRCRRPSDQLFARSITPYFVWDLSLSKLYSNCLMSTLNARERLNSSSNQSTFRARHSVLISPTRSGPGKQAIGQESFLDTAAGPLGTVTYDGGEDHQMSMPDLEYGIHMTKIVEHIDDSMRSSMAVQ